MNNTTIKFNYDGVDYTLEYDRESVKILENAGFKLDDFLDKPMTNIELAFAGAFLKHHKKTSQTTIDDIYKHMGDKTKLIQTLTKMIQETYDALLDDPENGDEGNVNWEVIDLSPKKSLKK